MGQFFNPPDFLMGDIVVIGENFKSHLEFLLRPPDLVIKLGMVEGQSTINRKCSI